MTEINSFESLLAQHEDASNARVVQSIQVKENEGPLKANKSANMDDFIEMVAKVISSLRKEYNVVFEMDEGKRLTLDPNEKVDNPFITYKVIERVPLNELKPRVREDSIQENTFSQNDARQGRVYGQKFKARIQFNVIASEYKLANRVMNNFEDLIFNYMHYFKKNGVAELLFEKHHTDSDYDIYRQNLSVRSLVYYVELEKLYVEFSTQIDNISTK